MKFLKSIDIGKEQVPKIILQKNKLEIVRTISKTNQFEWSIDYWTELEYAGEWALLFPSTWMYSIDKLYELENQEEFNSKLNSELGENWLSDISKLKISSILFDSVLTRSDYLFIRNILLKLNTILRLLRLS